MTQAPGPRLPYIGALIGPARDPLAMFEGLTERYGDVVRFRMANELVFLLNDPAHVRDVLVTSQRNFTKSRALERAKKMLGEGLLTSEGAAHLRQRRLMQPAFHRERIASYGEVMVERADRLRRRWHEGDALDVSKEMMHVTLSIVAKTLFDSDVESQADEVGGAVTDVLESFWFTLLPFQSLVDRLPLPVLRRARRSRGRLDALIYAMIAERRQSSESRGDLLSTLLAATDEEGGTGGLSDAQVRDEAMTLLLAGHETTANALMWTWYLLSQAPAVESALHAEVDIVLGGRAPAAADLSNLPFVERVVTESMRLYPPAWLVGRRAVAEHILGDYVIPPRAMLFMSPYLLQRDARYFPDPDRFNPDRWTADFKAALPKFAYFPFGGGVRQCIGEHFAWMELVLVVATIAQQWRLELAPGYRPVPQPLITLRSKGGMPMVAKRRAVRGATTMCVT